MSTVGKQSTTEEQLKEALVHLKKVREAEEKVRQAVRKVEEELRKHYAFLYERRDNVGQEKKKAESAVRELALQLYYETGDKTFFDRTVWIEQRTKFEIPLQSAVEWAVEYRLPHMLKLDETKYKTALKAGALPSDAPGRVYKSPYVKIASKIKGVGNE